MSRSIRVLKYLLLILISFSLGVLIFSLYFKKDFSKYERFDYVEVEENKNNLKTLELDNKKTVTSLVDQMQSSYIESTLRKMSVEEKVGQMFIWRAKGTTLDESFKIQLKNLNAGGVIFMGDNISPNISNFTKELQEISKIPLFISIDQEGGVVKRIYSDPNPGALVLRERNNLEICRVFQKTSSILSAQGVNLNFGVVADINWDSNSFISDRTFGTTPSIVSEKISKAITCTNTTLSTVKHFPGHGRTKEDSHKTIPIIKDINYETWLKTDAAPFIKAIEVNSDAIMIGHLNYSSIDNKPASLSQVHVKNLRNLGFNGLIITDDMGMLNAAGVDPFYALDQAVKAGDDVILYVNSPKDPEVLYNFILNKVKSGEIPESRIDESVRRILEKKFKVILMR